MVINFAIMLPHQDYEIAKYPDKLILYFDKSHKNIYLV